MFLMVEIAAISKPYNGVEKRTSGRAAAVREDTGAGAFTDRFFRNPTWGGSGADVKLDAREVFEDDGLGRLWAVARTEG